MKKTLLATAALSMATAAFGQGYVLFENANNSSDIGVCINQLDFGDVAQSGTYQVALLWYNGSSFQQLSVQTPPTNYADNGSFSFGVVAVPAYTAKGTFMIQGWTGMYPNFASAAANNALVGQAGPFYVNERTNPASALSITAPSDAAHYLNAGYWSGNLLLISFAPIAINGQPTNVSALVGSNVSFSVSASGTGLFYQWQLNGTNIPGAVFSSLNLQNVQLTNAGSYDVVVTNLYGSAASSLAVLSVGPVGAPSVYVNSDLAAITAAAYNSAGISFESGYTNGFVFYTLDGPTPTAASTLYSGPFTLTDSATIKALGYSSNFSQMALMQPLALEVVPSFAISADVTGNGSVGVNPNTNVVASNSVVILTAVPGPGWGFEQWEGSVNGMANPISVSVTSNLNVTAVFFQLPVYTVNTSISGGGSVSLIPSNATFASNSAAMLTATADSNYVFEQWEGDVNSTNNPLTINVDTNLNIQAVFLQNAYPVTLGTSGGGTVLANGQGATNTYFATGSTVTLTAVPDSGWTFEGWQEGVMSANNPYNLQITGPYRVEGMFSTVLQTNTTGGGQIVLNPGGVIDYGGTVTASAVPSNGNYFVLWSGIASGTNSPVVATVTNAQINALFAALPANTLSLSVVVMGNGQVSISPQESYYNYGDQVTLTATSNTPAYYFDGWSGGDNDTHSTTVVTVTTNLVVYANFSSAARPYLGVSFTSQGAQLEISGLNAQEAVTIYSSTNLVNWQPIFTNSSATSSLQFVDTNALNAPFRFYRAAQ